MSPRHLVSSMELSVVSPGTPWFLVEAEPKEGGRWLAYASIRAIVHDSEAGRLGPNLYLTVVLSNESEPGFKNGFLRVRSIYRLGDTLYLAQTVDDLLLLDNGQTVRLVHPWGSSSFEQSPAC